MNKFKLTILLLISAVIMLLTSCGGMMVEQTDNVSIDLSPVLSKAVTDDTYVKIWLFPSGTVSPYDLGAEAYQKVSADGTVTLSNIPVGPAYKIYLSVGKKSLTDVFTTERSFNGKVTVTGGTSTEAALTEVKFGERGVTLLPSYTGKSVKGAAVAGGSFYTVAAAGDKLFFEDAATSVAAAAGFTFNNVDAGYNNMAIVSAANSGGKGFVSFSGTTPNYAYADGLATAVSNAAVNIINADVFWDDTERVQMTVGHTEGGLILHMYIADDPATGGTDETVDEWMPVDLKPFLDEAGIPLAGQLIKGITVVKKFDTLGDLDSLWVFMVSKAGNFRIKVPVSGDGMDVAEDEIMSIFEDFVSDNGALADREVLNITNPSGDTLFIGTDSGLYKATATAAIADMNPTLIAASGSRVQFLASTSAYTACVTPLELLIYRASDKKVARISFNEGLPVSSTGLLTKGITGIAWDGTKLYVSGNYGVSTVDAANAKLWQ